MHTIFLPLQTEGSLATLPIQSSSIISFTVKDLHSEKIVASPI